MQKRIQRALTYIKERRAARDAKDDVKEMPLEKGDFFSMSLSALIIILPIALVVLLIIVGIAILWFG